MPFLLADPAAFMSSIAYNSAYVAAYAFERKVQLAHLGLGGWLLQFDLEAWVRPRQSVVAIAAYGCAVARFSKVADLLFLAGALYFCSLLINTVIFEYYYVEALVLMGFACVGRLHGENRTSTLRAE